MSTNVNQPTHRDHFGRAIEVGDIVLGAKPGGKFVDTTYTFAVVVSKTPRLLRVSQLHTNTPNVNKDIVMESLANRNGRRAGRLVPEAVISTGVNVGLTQAEMENAIKDGGAKYQQSLQASVTVGTSPLFI